MIIRACCYRRALCWTAFFTCLLASSAHALEADFSQPDLDWLAYTNSSGPGTRSFGPSWIGGLELDAMDQFIPLGKEDPSRHGTALIAFDTSSQVASGLAPHQYQIHSVTVTMTMASATFPGESLFYDDTPDTQAEILADIQSGNFDSQRPFELYGVGFRDGYTGFEFSTPASDPTLLDEGTHIYASSDGGYLAYPISSDSLGQAVDVSNSVTGGFSETAAGNSTAPFDPVPWAIGTTDLVEVGEAIPDNTSFTFEVNLLEPGVVEYLQQSLADGGVGFFVSSLNLATQPGLGVFPYPQWFLKESVGGAINGTPATLVIDVSVPGDFDEDFDVDALDLAEWESHYGIDDGADADADEDSDGFDFLAWQRNFVAPELSLSHVAVPEPSAFILLSSLTLLLPALGIRKRH